MGSMVRIRDNTEKIVEQETKFLETDNFNDKIDFLVRDYLIYILEAAFKV